MQITAIAKVGLWLAVSADFFNLTVHLMPREYFPTLQELLHYLISFESTTDYLHAITGLIIALKLDIHADYTLSSRIYATLSTGHLATHTIVPLGRAVRRAVVDEILSARNFPAAFFIELRFFRQGRGEILGTGRSTPLNRA